MFRKAKASHWGNTWEGGNAQAPKACICCEHVTRVLYVHSQQSKLLRHVSQKTYKQWHIFAHVALKANVSTGKRAVMELLHHGFFFCRERMRFKNLRMKLGERIRLKDRMSEHVSQRKERKEMKKELFRKGSPFTKATAAVLSLTLAFGMTPALALAQPTNEGGGYSLI